METEKFHSDSFYDAYVMGRLSGHEEDLFEEHLLFCVDCRREIELREAIVSSVRRHKEIPEYKSKGEKPSGSKIILRIAIAASVIIIVGYSLFLIFSPSGESDLVDRENPVTMDQGVGEQNETTGEISDTAVLQGETVKSGELIAASYIPFPMFENAIRNPLRSPGFLILSPDSSQTFKTNETIEFRWETGAEQLTLVIFNNQGSVLLEEMVKSPFILQDTLPPGLYYWQLETSEEAMITSRFFIR